MIDRAVSVRYIGDLARISTAFAGAYSVGESEDINHPSALGRRAEGLSKNHNKRAMAEVAGDLSNKSDSGQADGSLSHTDGRAKEAQAGRRP